MVADANFRTFLVLRLGRWRQARLRLRRGGGRGAGAGLQVRAAAQFRVA